MNKQKVTEQELKDEMERWRIVFRSDREGKELFSTLHGNMCILVAGNRVWEGTETAAAVKVYNEITATRNR